MRKIYFLFCVALSLKVYAQNCAPNGITTNPVAPVNTQNPSKLNTFDFTAPQFSLNWIYNYNNTNYINSPYFDTDNSGINQFYDPIDGIKDIYPSEGWELIKKDFGYADNGTPNNPATANPYLIVYNKYRGLMRIFVARGDQQAYNGANIRLKFIDISPMQTSLLDLSGELQAINAPFTKGKSHNSVTKFINLPLKWFYADFPMLYDPCTCLYESKLEIIVTLSSTSTLTAQGTLSGNIVSQGEPTLDQQGKSSFSIGNLNSTAKKITEGYKTGQSFKENNNIRNQWPIYKQFY